MKQLKAIVLLMLALCLALGSLTSCEYLEQLGIQIPGATPDETPDDKPNPDECGHYVTTLKNKIDATCTTEGYSGDKVCYACGTELAKGTVTEKTAHSFKDGTCSSCGAAEPTDPNVPDSWKQYDTITIDEALALCDQFKDAPSTDRYYIIATVKTVTNPNYGAMVIEYEGKEIPVYNSASSDGSVGYADMTEKPYKGDYVLLYCTLQSFNGTKEIKSAYIIDFNTPDVEIDESDYTEMTVAEAREASDGTLVKASGVVARITYADGYIPMGFFLIDNTQSIYVYDANTAARVSAGNKITILAAKDHWILETEQTNADKFGYKGCNQLTSVTLLDNDGGNHDFDKSWITETTVKSVMDTPVTEDITTTIFKVTALISKAPGAGFINYYIDDLDGVTGTYVYTQCSGGDFEWLDEFDGKICTVYLTALNAKSSAAGCNWRFIPVEVIDEGYTFDVKDAPEFAVKYHGLTAFESEYMIGAKIELPASVSSELLGFAGVTLTYDVSDPSLASVTGEDDKLYFNTLSAGTVTVTVKATYEGGEYEEDITIVINNTVHYDSISVGEAINTENNTEVIIKGIVGPSAVNQNGTFYLIDESGAVPVRGTNEIMAGLSIGDEVVIKGTRTITKDGSGQIVIDSAVILANYYGEHDYSTASFITDKTIAQIKAISDTPEATTGVYVVTVKITKNVTPYSTTYSAGNLLLYSGKGEQYAWLDQFFAENETTSKEVTLELALCDWNANGLKGCALAVYNEDGTKTYNTWNFN